MAFPGGPAFARFGDVHVARGTPHPAGDDVGEELPGSTDERLASPVLFFARAFADEQQSRVRITHTEDDLRATFGELAAVAIADLFAELAERRRAIDVRRGDGLDRRRRQARP